MSIHGNARKLLDEELCFKLWVELDSITKVQSHMKLAGMVNPNNGKEFTQMAVWNAAIRWVLEHPDEARKHYKAKGSTLSDLQWEEWLTEKAMFVYGGSSKSRFFKWIRKMGYDKYDYVYAKRYGMEAVHTRPVSE